MDGLVNWEGSQTSDGDRFSQNFSNGEKKKSLRSFAIYLERKEKRAAEKLLKKQSRVKQEQRVVGQKLLEVSEVLKKDLAI